MSNISKRFLAKKKDKRKKKKKKKNHCWAIWHEYEHVGSTLLKRLLANEKALSLKALNLRISSAKEV